MEVKDFTFDLKASDERTIEGLGSVFGNVDNGNDIVLPGAFAKSIASRMPVMLWQHKQDQVPGVWLSAAESTHGLHLKGAILETQLGNDAYTLVKAGAIKGLSIGYTVKDSSFDRKSGVRQLRELVLHEVSLVTFPMNEAAGITRVKSAGRDIDEMAELLGRAIEMCKAAGCDDELKGTIQSALDLLDGPDGDDGAGQKLSPKNIERILREAGMSRSDARGVLAKGYTAIAAPREAGGQEHERLVKFINSLKC